VLGLVADRDAAEGQPDELAAELVVIADHVDDLRSLARLAQHLLHDVVVRLRPEEAVAQCPAVDHVTDQVQKVRLVMAQEVEQVLRLAAARAQMRIGDEDRAIAALAAGRQRRRVDAGRRAERGGKCSQRR
jgi:hypothetical protein